MPIVKQSLLSNILGRSAYDEFKAHTKYVIAIGTCILLLLFMLSKFVHWGIICSLLNLITGTSLLFIAYIAALIITLDIEVDVEEPERNDWSKDVKIDKPIAYKMTIVWGVLLVILGITAIYYTNKYRKQYAFECETFLVDKHSGIYHLNFDNDCEIAESTNSLVIMKGYEIKDFNYTLCKWCDEWASDEESYYNSNRYTRR
jgi:uncharacterized membrane protein